MVDLEEIKNELLSGKPAGEILKKVDWKSFEETIAEIFRSNDFIVKQNFRFKTKSRHEIDLIAVRSGLVVCADCKNWSMGRYKVSALKKAVSDQENRVGELKKFLKKNPIAQKLLKVENNFLFSPLLVTSVEEGIVRQGDTYLVPFERLNAFILDIENYT